MKFSSFAFVLASAIVASNFAFAVDGQGHQLSSGSSTSLREAASKMVLAQSSTQYGSERSIIIVGGKTAKSREIVSPGSSERSIIIVGGKNAKSESVGSPGSKVMLNPQPLPPRTKLNTSINSNGSSGSERSIIIVGGKNSESGAVVSPGSKVMLNPQPLPPKAR
jgi:hypothetical protein